MGNAGTIEGTVLDPSGAAVAGAQVTISNPVSGYKQAVTSAAEGAFRLVNIPPNPYHLEVTAPGFSAFFQDVAIRGGVPLELRPTLVLAGSQTSITVEAAGADILENTPSAHVDVDRSLMIKLPVFDPAANLSESIVYTTGGAVADANGFFHPQGDHGQVSFLIDGQEISDQQSKLFSTQLPTNAIQGMETTTGTPDAEFGDKSSMVIQMTTRSGLGAGKVFGNVDATYGSFGTAGGSASIGFGNARFGNFIAVNGLRTGRFLDAPEFTPFHDAGNNGSIFDRFDYQPGTRDVFHLNLFTARNWFQIPNSYDQLGQDQHQRVLTWSIAPGYQHTFNPHTLLSVNPYIRKDQVNYYPSGDLFADTPATQSQNRQLLNWGVKADVSVTAGRHNMKYGIDLKQTRLLENFGFGITEPGFSADYPGLLPYDLTRGGRLFAFHETGNINQYALYAQDAITAGNFLFNLGFRFDGYDGLVSRSGPQPRLGVSYNVKGTATVLRAAYARAFETPFNENLLLSSATGVGGLAGNVFGSTSVAISPGFRNQFNAGLQQALGRWLLIDADYFWKYTHNAYDFSTLLNTTITFPIAWHNSKIDGVTGRVSTTNLRGFQAYWTFGHTRARYFPPETGGLVPQGAPLTSGVFRIDHDQAFQSTSVLRYQHKDAEWVAFTWRYDSGLVVSGVPDAGAALIILTPNQQTTIGLACGGVRATPANPLTPANCAGPVTSTLLALPQGGYNGTPSQENDDHNPGRVLPRHVFNVGVGTDNLFHAEHRKMTASMDIENLTNEVALYNFLSTFSGTHFLQPRTVVARVGFVF
ncbi:MAG: carboxypeptidase regulatory-like domain-containing protein [Acidobacteriia bacterium]|nr:carboxypeptidase regulatory-like domain-containing protein [Terriglobia bacterium]